MTDMRLKTHNGFILAYDGDTFPATSGNAITYEYFCLRGGIANKRNHRVSHYNGTHHYFTYHDISTKG